MEDSIPRTFVEQQRRSDYRAVAIRFVGDYCFITLACYTYTLLVSGVTWPTINTVLWIPLAIAGIDAIIIAQQREKSDTNS